MAEPNDEAPQEGQVTLEGLDAISESAFHEARAAHRRKGVPLVFVRDGQTLWELPDGTITDVNPLARVEERPAVRATRRRRTAPEKTIWKNRGNSFRIRPVVTQPKPVRGWGCGLVL